jgi:flagellin
MDAQLLNTYKEVMKMGFRINTNIAALNAQRHLGNISSKLDKSLERLASGLRINKSADDASGMATSVYLRGQIGGLHQAARNANDAISMTQTAEGALDITTNILLGLRDLAVQSATDTTNRDLLIQESSQLVAELTRIAGDTEFVGNVLLDGSFQSGKIQIGANQGQTISFSIGDVRAAALGARANVEATLDTGTDEGGFTVGEMVINDVMVVATAESSDQVSVMDLAGSSSVSSGIVGGVSVTGLVINGATLGTFIIASGGTAASFLTAALTAINNETATTGVTAREGSGTTLVLTADQGRNITFDLDNTNISGATSLAGVLGLAAGYFASGTTNTLYNGESGAIAKVAAIDRIKSQTAVDALAVATTVTGSAAVTAGALAAGDLYINGIDIGAVSSIDAGDSTGVLLAAINAKSATTGVTASISRSVVTLTASDGRNISVVATGGASETNLSTLITRGGVKLNSTQSFSLTGTTADFGNVSTGTYATNLDASISLIDLSTQVGADDALASLDAAIYQVNETRSSLGAIQSRISLTIVNLTTTAENLSASDSRIKDVDFAEETSVFTRNSILTQAATAILAQANQLPQLALQLLG